MFQSHSVGIDISDSSIQIAFLKGGKRPSIASSGKKDIPEGVIVKGRIQNEEKLKMLLKEALLNAHPKPIMTRKAFFALPEELVYIHTFDLPAEFQEKATFEKDILVRKEAERVIPLEEGDLLVDYRVRQALGGRKEIFLLAASKQAVLEWDRFFRKIGIGVEAFDMDLLALFRAVKMEERKGGATCLIDIGERRTAFGVFEEGELKYAHSLELGGKSITQEVAGSLKIKQEDAETKKITLGLGEGSEPKDFGIIKALQPILEEIKLANQYCQEKKNVAIRSIVLAGGSSQLKGLVEYIAANTGMSVRPASARFPGIHAELLLAYGLALRGLQYEWSTTTPAISLGVQQVFSASRGAIERIMKIGGIVLGVCLILFGTWYGWAYWVKNKNTSQQPVVENFTQEQTLPLRVPVAVSSLEFTDDRVHARLMEYDVTKGVSYDQALLDAALVAEKDVKPGEKIWPKPIRETQTVFTMLLYPEEEVSRLIQSEIAKNNPSNLPYKLTAFKEDALEPTENKDIYYMRVRAILAVNEKLPESHVGPSADSTTPPPDNSETVQYVLVKETETGWLNVRSGAGSSFSVLKKIYPGEKYEFLGSSTDWTHIRLSPTQDGWVASRYVEK